MKLTPDEEDDKNNVRINGRDPNDKRVLRDTLNDALKLEKFGIFLKQVKTNLTKWESTSNIQIFGSILASEDVAKL